MDTALARRPLKRRTRNLTLDEGRKMEKSELNNPKVIVREGYDKISRAYRGDTFDFENSAYRAFLRELEPFLKPGARILDLGCGCGVPVAQYLAKNHTVTGVDIAETQIVRARTLVPNARFLCADMTEAAFADGSFEAVISFYAVIHVPLEQQFALFQRIARWLAAGGCLLVTVGHAAWTGTKDDWHGATMYWSQADAATYRDWLTQTGFDVLAERFIPEGEGGHALFIARKR